MTARSGRAADDALSLANARVAVAAESEVFLAQAVHELRSPVTVLCGLAETLGALIEPGQVSPRAALAIEGIARTGRNLRLLVNDLLQSAYLEHGDLPLEPAVLPILPLLQWAVTDAGVGGDDVEIACDPLLHGRFDPDRFQQVVRNLVGNAAQHGAMPIVVAAHASSRGDEVIVSVTDVGLGVTPEDAAHLFDRFGVLAGASTTSTGLGLSIARRLARAMGGDLVYLHTDEGTRFTLTVPGPLG